MALSSWLTSKRAAIAQKKGRPVSFIADIAKHTAKIQNVTTVTERSRKNEKPYFSPLCPSPEEKLMTVCVRFSLQQLLQRESKSNQVA
jgi:hypothetical protein